MTEGPGPAGPAPLLGNAELARIERLRIQSSRRFTSRGHGDHRSRGGGRSIEFKDYRDYVPGDDIRFVDWNVFVRLQRPYLKLFHDEEEQHVVVLLDASASMGFEDKLERARQLAGAFAVMGLVAGERVSLHELRGHDDVRSLRVPRGRKGMAPALRFVEQVECGGDHGVEAGMAAVLKQHRGRGVLIVLSDLLTTGELRPALNLAFGRGLEVMALQVLGPSEIEPRLENDLRLVDAESGSTLDISVGDDLLGLYRERLQALQRGLAALCRGRSGRFLGVSSAATLAEIVFQRLRGAGWVA